MMTPVLAAYADAVIIDAFKIFVAVVAITSPFGVVYWLIRRARAKREVAERKKWIEDRRALRGGEKKDEPGDRQERP